MATKRKRWTVAAVQMRSTANVRRNVAQALERVHLAADGGADLVALPENLAYLRKEGTPVEFRETLDGEVVRRFRETARRRGVYVLLGSIPEKIPRSRKVFNTSVLIGPAGRVLAVYRKMHLFDIAIRGAVVLRESRTVRAGDLPVVATTPLGRLGLSICYDLRFPELCRPSSAGTVPIVTLTASPWSSIPGAPWSSGWPRGRGSSPPRSISTKSVVCERGCPVRNTCDRNCSGKVKKQAADASVPFDTVVQLG
jgi:predicted amidohydrolase